MRRGFSIIEILLAAAVFMAAAMVLFTFFSGSQRQAVQTRNRTLALLIAGSLLEEVRAHPFGEAVPRSWPLAPAEESFKFYVEGKSQLMRYRKEIKLSTGALVGRSDKDFDQATVVISWRESTGEKSVTANARVWRPYALPPP